MKKLYALTISILLVSIGHAQVYYPMLDSMSNIWYYTLNILPVRVATTGGLCDYSNAWSFESNNYFTSGDTMMSGNTYQKLLTQDNQVFPPVNCTYGYLREDTASRKIYFVDNVFSPETVLYDFSMSVGDSIYLSFMQSGWYYTTGYFRVDSIRTINIRAGTRNIFYLNNHLAPSPHPLEWIESVGHPGHLVYTYSANGWGGLFQFFCFDQLSRDFYQILTCFEHNAQKVYFDSCAHSWAVQGGCFYYADSCNYWNICGSLEDDMSISQVKIAPNPFSDNTTLLVRSWFTEDAVVQIFDPEGRFIGENRTVHLVTGENQIPIYLSRYPGSVYFIRVTTNRRSIYSRAVKMGGSGLHE